MSDEASTRLKSLLQQRHLHGYSAFCLEYDKISKAIDPKLAGTYPSRAQFHRWVTGTVKNLPYASHCAVLESMFPDWSAEQLFEMEREGAGTRAAATSRPLPKRDIPGFLGSVDESLKSPDGPAPSWGSPEPTPASPVVRPQPSPITDYSSGDVDGLAHQLGRKLIELSRLMRLTDAETRQLANLTGHIVELELNLGIDIAPDGKAQVVYEHDLLNLSDTPLSRMPREVWFKHAYAPISITPTQYNERRIMIQRIHDAGSLAKFAFKISPPLQPGERTTIRYTCGGGLFSDELYWRQVMPRYTRRYSFKLRHQGIGRLGDVAAIVEHPDGSETYVTEGLLWDYDHDDATVTVAVDYLRAGQAVELRWER